MCCNEADGSASGWVAKAAVRDNSRHIVLFSCATSRERDHDGDTRKKVDPIIKDDTS